MRRPAIIISTILLVLILILGATYSIGYIVEKRFRQTMSMMSEIPGTHVDILSYERSFFKSLAKISVQIYNQSVLVQSDIYHGPIIFKKEQGSTAPLHFQLAYVSNQLESSLIKIPVNWIMVFPYIGGVEMKSKVPAYSVEQDRLLVKSLGWDAIAKITRAWDHYHLQFFSNDLTVAYKGDMEGPFLDMRGIKLENDYKKEKNLKTSTINYFFDRILLPKHDAALHKVLFHNVLTTKQETLDSLFKINIESLALNKNQSLETERVEVKIENIDLAALITLLQSNKNQLSQDQLQDVFKKLFQRRIRILVNNSLINLPDGFILVDGKIELGGQILEDAMNTNEIIKTLDGILKGRVTKPLFRNIISQMAVQELIKDPKFVALKEEEKLSTLNLEVDRFIKMMSEGGLLQDLGQEYEIILMMAGGQWISQKTQIAPMPDSTPSLQDNPSNGPSNETKERTKEKLPS